MSQAISRKEEVFMVKGHFVLSLVCYGFRTRRKFVLGMVSLFCFGDVCGISGTDASWIIRSHNYFLSYVGKEACVSFHFFGHALSLLVLSKILKYTPTFYH